MNFDIRMKSYIRLSEDELNLYKIGLEDKEDLTIMKVPVYCVFGTYNLEPYFFDRIYSFVYTDGENTKLLDIYDRNDKNDTITITDKEDSYAIIAIYQENCLCGRLTARKEKTKVVKLVYNPNTKW